MIGLLVAEGGCLRLSTEGTGFDTVLHVRSDCRTPEREVACNDDAVGLQSAVELQAQAGGVLLSVRRVLVAVEQMSSRCLTIG